MIIKKNRSIIENENTINISMISNIFSKWEVQLNKLDIDVNYYCWIFIVIWWLSRKSFPNRMIKDANNFVTLLIRQT